MFRAGLLVLFAALGFLALAEELSGPRLVAELREGGYVLYIRHTATDFGKDDSKMTSFEDCATQRNLTDAGRDQARRLGAEIRRVGVPIGEVLASPFCRTVETAMLAFGKATKAPALRGGPVRADDPKRYQGLKEILQAKPAAGTNTVISSHGNPYYAVFGPPYLTEGELAVIRPLGGGKFEVVARIRLEEWEFLAR